jgi:hypothetical protein
MVDKKGSFGCLFFCPKRRESEQLALDNEDMKILAK